MQGSGDSVTARGNVRTTLYNTAAEGSKSPIKSFSDQLIARRNDKRVELLGKVTMIDEARTLKSEKAIIFLDDNRKIQKMEAETNVSVVDGTTGRKGNGNKVVYQVDKKMIYMFGKPATISDLKGGFSGEQIVFDLTRDRVNVLSPDTQTKGTYKNEGGGES